jgi:hypothetical protein
MVQQNPTAVSDGAGGAIVVWEDLRDYSTNGYDLYAQHVLASGLVDPAWPANGLAVSVAGGDQAFPAIVPDGAGGAFVSWQDTRDYNVSGYDAYAQHVLANGTVDPTWPANGQGLVAASSQFRAVIVADGSGGVIVAWFDNRDGGINGNDIYAGHILANGNVDASWTPGGAAVCVATTHDMNPVIASDGAGGAIIAWEVAGGGIYANRILSNGAHDPAWPTNGRPLCTSIISQQRARILAVIDASHPAVVFDNFDAGGGFSGVNNLGAASVSRNGSVQAYRAAAKFTVASGSFNLASITLPISLASFGVGNPNILRVRLAADDGGAPGTTLEVLSENQAIWPPISNPFTTTTTLSSTLHPLLAGGQSYWIVTEPTIIPPDVKYGVDYRWFYNTSAVTVPARQQSEFDALPVDPWSGFAGPLNLAFRVDGTTQGTVGAIVVWEDYRAGSTNGDIYAQHVRSDGVADPSWPADGLAICDTTGQQQRPEIATDGADGAIVAWQDARLGPLDIFAQHVQSVGTVDPAWPARGRALCLAAGDQQFPAIVSDAVGGAIVAWQDARTANVDIYGQRVRSGGAVDPAWPANGLQICGNFSSQFIPTIVSDGSSGAIVAWQDARGGPSTGYDIYAQRAYAVGGLAAASPTERPARFQLLAAYPNPARSCEMTIPVELPAAQRVAAIVVDLAGRRVRRLANREFPEGHQLLRWDGRDDAGAPLAGGVYFIHAQAGPVSYVERVVLLR